MSEAPKRKKSWKRETLEWIIPLGLIAALYLTGTQAEVLGLLQRLMLSTGLLNAKTQMEYHGQADFNWHLIDAQENQLSLAQFKGKTIFINLWATWCPPCVAEMPSIQKLYETQGQEVEFILLSRDEDFAKALAFTQSKGYTFPVYTSASATPPVFQAQAIPTTFVIDPNGQIIYRHSGMAQYDGASFKELLNKAATIQP
ncbi:MAG: TlpA family protein disulfide reductase [Cytophagales bacterium]|nr:TlpA family protein disulfide reductase [Cytophagales bacterium]